jgi:hypothetical protein
MDKFTFYVVTPTPNFHHLQQQNAFAELYSQSIPKALPI